MELNRTKYKNNLRLVSGANVVVFKDDSYLSVDTLSAACTIDIPKIPDSNWNTLYKLFIYDSSGNAATNTITLNAPYGQTINGQSTVVVNVDNGAVTLRIIGKNRYSATFAYTIVSAGSGHIIEDEGVTLPQQPIMNFIGAGVTAYDAGGKTIVLVNGVPNPFIVLTVAAMQALIIGSGVTVGAYYLITDANLTNGGIVIQGIAINEVSLEGKGFFLNPDFQKVGTYSAVVGFNSAMGIWSAAKIFTVGDVVIWNNQHYFSVTGLTGTQPNLDVINWQNLSKSIDTGFILEVDFIKYNAATDQLLYRADNRLNEVDYGLDGKGQFNLIDFPWGNNDISENKIFGSCNLYFNNSSAVIYNNIISKSTVFILDDYDPLNKASIIGNSFTGVSQLSLNAFLGTVEDNILESGGQLEVLISGSSGTKISSNYISSGKISILVTVGVDARLSYCEASTNGTMVINIINNKRVQECVVSKNGDLSITNLDADLLYCGVHDELSVYIPTISVDTIRKVLRENYSNWETTLDWSDLAVKPSLDTLVIDASLDYVGIFNCLNCSALAFSKLIGTPKNHDITIVPVAGFNFRVTTVPVGIATTNELLGDTFTSGSTLLTGRISTPDYCVLRRKEIGAVIPQYVFLKEVHQIQ